MPVATRSRTSPAAHGNGVQTDQAEYSVGLQNSTKLRARFYDPSTGEFSARDPKEYVDGASLMRGYLALDRKDPQRRSACAAQCCVESRLKLQADTIPLQGGWDADDYVPGATWGQFPDKDTTGPKSGTDFAVQLIADFSGNEDCGVSQTITLIDANYVFLKLLEEYAGSTAFPVREPLLNEDPFDLDAWIALYEDGKMSFYDLPGGWPGAKGTVVFTTCFHSRVFAEGMLRPAGSEDCRYSKCCIIWTYEYDWENTKDGALPTKNNVEGKISWCVKNNE